MSIASITRRTLTEEILKLEEKAEYITRLKNEAIQNLLEQKEAFLQGVPGIQLSPSSIDRKIEKIETQHRDYMEKFESKQPIVEEYKRTIDELKQGLKELDDELRTIQERHDQVMDQLNEKKAFLQERLASIEKLDIILTELTGARQKSEETYQNELESLMKQRHISMQRTDLSPEAMVALIESIDKQIEDKEREHVIEMNMLNNQIMAVQSDMSSSVETLKRRCSELQDEKNRLESSKTDATPSEVIMIEEQIKLTQLQIDECIRMRDIAGLSTREKLDKILTMRGMHLTSSGRLSTTSGKVLSLDEARRIGLLDDLDEELMQLRGLTQTPSGRIQTRSGNLYSASEAERMGLFTSFSLEELATGDESESYVESSSSSASTMSGLSSSDVHYLKNVLGKPLSYALAEITAKQPRDPIHYLGHWLYKYRYNQEIEETKKKELSELIAERERLALEQLRRLAEEEAKATLIDLLGRVDVAIDRIAIEKELKRIEAEAAMMEAENEDLAEEAKDTLGVYNGPTTGQKL